MKLQYPTPQTALKLERAGFDKLPVTTTQMRSTSSVRAQLFPRLIGNLDVLLFTLVTPSLWSHFANEEAFHLLVLIFQAAQTLNIPYNETYRVPSETVNLGASLFKLGTDRLGSNPAQNLTSHVCVCVFLLYSVQLEGQRSPLSTTALMVCLAHS